MGFNVLLIRITNKDPSIIHQEYGVTPTNVYEEIPESPVSSLSLPEDAYLLYVNDDVLPDDSIFARLSQNASLTTCYVDETSMNSVASGWVNGVQQWSVFHDAQQDIRHLEAEGDLPDEFYRIRDGVVDEQEEGDDEVDCFFNAPVSLFVSLGGIRYDEDPEGCGPNPWQVLDRIKHTSTSSSKKKKKWWLFGS